MTKKMILSGLVGAAITAGVGFAAWVGPQLFDESIDIPATLEAGSLNKIIAVADFDQDGFDDLVIEVINGPNYRCAILLNQSGTGYTEVWGTSATSGGWRTADVDGDGYPDLIAVGSSSFEVYINQLSLVAACPSDLDKTGATEVGDLLFVIDRWGPCEES